MGDKNQTSIDWLFHKLWDTPKDKLTWYALLKEVLSDIVGTNCEIISGGARGADALAKKYALENNIPYKEFTADWGKHNKSAGIVRNKQMAEYGDMLVSFWDGESKGSKNMIENMKKLNKHVVIVRV